MKVTEDGFKNRQLHIEDYLQMVSAEQKEYAEVFAPQRITETDDIITNFCANNLLDLILRKDNLNEGLQRQSIKGSSMSIRDSQRKWGLGKSEKEYILTILAG